MYTNTTLTMAACILLFTGCTSTNVNETENAKNMINITPPSEVGRQLTPTPADELYDTISGTLKLAIANNATDAINSADGWPVSLPITLHVKDNKSSKKDFGLDVQVFKHIKTATDLNKHYKKETLTQGKDFTLEQTKDALNIHFLNTLTPSTHYSYSVNKPGSSTVARFSDDFKTTSVGNVIDAVKNIIEKSQSSNSTIEEIYGLSKSLSNQAYSMSFSKPVDFLTALNNDKNLNNNPYHAYKDMHKKISSLYKASDANVNVTKGIIYLPYFLETNDNWNKQAMESAIPNTSLLLNTLNTPEETANLRKQINLNTNESIDLSKLSTSIDEQIKLIGKNFYLKNGQPLDPERKLTHYSSIPKLKSVQPVNFLLFTPKNKEIKDIVIYQHGASNVKEDAYSTAFRIAQAGLAVIAIDGVYHGERALSKEQSANTDIFNFFNLSKLSVFRDNIRQNILDIIGLRAGLAINARAGLFKNTPLSGFDIKKGSKVKMLGFSLGGILSYSVVSRANSHLDTSLSEELFKFSSLSVRSSGGHLGSILLGSDYYHSAARYMMAYQLSENFRTFASQDESVQFHTTTTDEKRIPYRGECYKKFVQTLSESEQRKLDNEIMTFYYTLQTVLDVIDPYTNAKDLLDSNGKLTTPVFITEMDQDYAMPNKVDWAPFAGTYPMAKKLGLEIINNTNPNIKNENAIMVQFNADAEHGTFAMPLPSNIDLRHHNIMLKQTVEFLKNDSLSSVFDISVLK